MYEGIIKKGVAILIGLGVIGLSHAGTPVWTFEPSTRTTQTVSTNGTATVKYKVTNQSTKTHKLIMKAIPGVSQVTSSQGDCPNPFILAYNQFCTLHLIINGSALKGDVIGGPVVCTNGNVNQCYQPNKKDILKITRPVTPGRTTLSITSDVVLSVKGLTEYGLTPSTSGKARVIRVQNTGTTDAINVVVSSPSPALPKDAMVANGCKRTL